MKHGAPETLIPSGAATRQAVIVAHGQPSDPEPAGAEIAALAAAVERLLPGWSVGAATLAQEGALARAVAGAADILVYPLFMADGWFTATHLPARLAAAGAGRPHILAPFGLDPSVQALTVTLAIEAADGLPIARTTLLLAAHGSFRSDAPASVARAMADRIAAAVPFQRVETAFIDQTPRIVDVAATLARSAVCLPFFAAKGGHVTEDLPRALASAGFTGRLAEPVGCDPRVPALIASALASAA